MQKLEANHAALIKRGKQLEAHRLKAQRTMDAALEARLDVHLSGDLEDTQALSKAQANADAASSAVAGIGQAITALGKQIADSEAQLDAERDRIARENAAKQLTAQLSAIEAALPGFHRHVRTLIEAMDGVPLTFELGRVLQHAKTLDASIKNDIDLYFNEMKAMPAQIVDGEMDIPRPKSEPAPAVIPQRPETRMLWLIKSIRYVDADGKFRSGLQFEDHEFDLQTAERAILRRVAVEVTDPRRKRLHGARGGLHPKLDATDIVNLDVEPVNVPSSDPISPEFTVIDRTAEAFTIKTHGPQV